MHTVQRSRSEPNVFARSLFDRLPARYDLLAEVLSFGQNRRWRAAMVDAVAAMRAGARPGARRRHRHGWSRPAAGRPDAGAEVVGVDLTEPMLRAGRRRRRRRVGRGTGSSWSLGRAEQLPFPDAAFDAVTFTYLLRYVADPAATLRELARVLRPGGTMASPGVLRALAPGLPAWLERIRPRGAPRPRGSSPAGGSGTRSAASSGPSISEHYQRYPLSWTVDAWRAAGLERRDHAAHEPRRRPGHVGMQGRWLLDRRPRLLRAGGAAGGPTGGRCCTRPTRPGTCRTSLIGAALAPRLDWAALGATRPRLLPGRRAGRARPRRAQRAGRCGPGSRTRRSGRWRSLALAGAVRSVWRCFRQRAGAGAVHRGRRGAGARLQPRALRRAAAHRHRLRGGVGRLPGRGRLRRAGAGVGAAGRRRRPSRCAAAQRPCRTHNAS